MKMAMLVLGFIEIEPYPKNLRRQSQPRAISTSSGWIFINRMGFIMEAVLELSRRLKSENQMWFIGGILGKNKATPNKMQLDDLPLFCLEALHDHVELFLVNVSSQTSKSSRFTEKEPIWKHCFSCKICEWIPQTKTEAILLKIAPDLTDGQLDDNRRDHQETKKWSHCHNTTIRNRSGLSTDKMKLKPSALEG